MIDFKDVVAELANSGRLTAKEVFDLLTSHDKPAVNKTTATTAPVSAASSPKPVAMTKNIPIQKLITSKTILRQVLWLAPYRCDVYQKVLPQTFHNRYTTSELISMAMPIISKIPDLQEHVAVAKQLPKKEYDGRKP